MKPVERDEIVDYVTYEDERDAFRRKVIEAKAKRRVHVGQYLTLLFENRLTVRYQIQEMIRAERIVRESGIHHEIETYNELLGGKGELGCTLLIEIDDPIERNEKLTSWLALPDRIYLKLADGRQISAKIDERQREDQRLSSVQYLKFDTMGLTPVAVGVDLADFTEETPLTLDQQEALTSDLAED